MLASRAEVQRFANSPLVHLRDNLPTMALCQPSLSSQLFVFFPFIGKLLRQFSVRCFCAPFEPSNPSVTSNAVVTGNPEGAFRRLMCVFGDRCHTRSELMVRTFDNVQRHSFKSSTKEK